MKKAISTILICLLFLTIVFPKSFTYADDSVLLSVQVNSPEASVTNTCSSAYEAYYNIIQSQYDILAAYHLYNNYDQLNSVVLCDVYGDEIPELLYVRFYRGYEYEVTI